MAPRAAVTLVVVLLLTAAACGRDFSLPGSAPTRVSSVEVHPAHAALDTPVAVTFTVQGSTDTPEVSLLGRLLTQTSGPDDGVYRYEYTPRGDEPEDVDLAIDIAVAGAGARGQVRFDFTPPQLVEAAATPLSAGAGETVRLDVIASEALAFPPEVVLAGVAVDCEAAAGTERFRCDLPVTAALPAGWLLADLRLVDLAGNETLVEGRPVGAAIDHGAPPVFEDLSVSPNPAGPHAELTIHFRSSVPLAAPPDVAVAGRPADPTGGPAPTGEWAFAYRVTGLELGLAPAEDTVPVTVSGESPSGAEGTAEGEVRLDFEPPHIETVVAAPTHVAAGQTVVVTLTAHEPLAALSVEVQGRTLTCAPETDHVWSCAHLTSGQEIEGPQSLTVRAADRVGNLGVSIVDNGFAFDFRCVVDPSRIYVVHRHGAAPALLGTPGAFEAGSSVTVETDAAPLTATAAADGSLEVPDLPSETVVVHAVDPLGHACPPVVPRRRFVADLAGRTAGNPSAAGWAESGVVAPGIRFFEGSEPLDPEEHDALASGAGIARTAAALAAGMDWEPVESAGGAAPEWPGHQPVVFHPRYRRTVVWEYSGSGSGRLFRWDGEGWTVGFEQGPDATNGFHLVHDPRRDGLLLYGGYVSGSLFRDQTWVRGAAGWYQWLGTPRPPARMFGAMAVDSRRGKTVLFGGAPDGSGAAFGDTWVWDGIGWQRREPPRSPPARSHHAMAFDPERGRIVLFGGAADGFAGETLSDTWEWTGSGWIEVDAGEGPSPRSLHAMAWHPHLGAVVLHGGQDADGTILDDMWRFEGGRWLPVETPSPAPDRRLHGMAFDPDRGRLVIQGGGDSGGPTEAVAEMTPGMRHLHLWSELGGWPQQAVPDSVRLQVVAEAGGHALDGSPQSDLGLRVWDVGAGVWRLLETEPSEEGGLVATIPTEHVETVLGAGVLFVLVGPEGAATVEGPSSLSVTRLEAVLDW